MTAQCTLYMGALKIFGTNYAHGSQIMGFCSDRVIGPMNVLTKFEVRSWDNRGYPKLGSAWIHPRSLFFRIFNGLLFGWVLRMYLPNLNSVALSISELIWDSQTNFGQSWLCPHALSTQNSHRPTIQTIYAVVHSFCQNFRLEFWVRVANLQSREGV